MAETFGPDDNKNNNTGGDGSAEQGPADSPTTPSTSNALSITALARFEFEAGKGNEGTKILMVEWEEDDDEVFRSAAGYSWHVSWEGKTNVLPADEQASERTRRFYFLLPPGVTIPPVVTLTQVPNPDSALTAKQPRSIKLNPLPAIFPAELGATARTAGKKGVLHTIWAKKRLQALEKEIRHEAMTNSEGVALVMAIQEKEWIESHFGVSLTSSSSSSAAPTMATSPAPSSSSLPTNTPISPTAGTRLGEKLRGLKLETSEKELTKRDVSSNRSHADAHPLSPESPDVAVSSFTSFRDASIPSNTTTSGSRIVAHEPPASIRQAQKEEGDHTFVPLSRTESNDSADGLFAKELSPRTPDLPRSPFSFHPRETMC